MISQGKNSMFAFKQKFFQAYSLSLLAACLVGCATPFDNQPQNQAITPDFVTSASKPRGIVDANTIGLSLSGGGLRASAFALGV